MTSSLKPGGEHLCIISIPRSCSVDHWEGEVLGIDLLQTVALPTWLSAMLPLLHNGYMHHSERWFSWLGFEVKWYLKMEYLKD